jgi:hypothetical protein
MPQVLPPSGSCPARQGEAPARPSSLFDPLAGANGCNPLPAACSRLERTCWEWWSRRGSNPRPPHCESDSWRWKTPIRTNHNSTELSPAKLPQPMFRFATVSSPGRARAHGQADVGPSSIYSSAPFFRDSTKASAAARSSTASTRRIEQVSRFPPTPR